jgi:hypothetical protein
MFNKKPINKNNKDNMDTKIIDKKQVTKNVEYILTKEPDIKDVKEIIISDRCLESDPCQHNIIFVLHNNTRYYGSDNGLDIAIKYWDFLSQENKYHFYDYKEKNIIKR